jgi:hypothetical protein
LFNKYGILASTAGADSQKFRQAMVASKRVANFGLQYPPSKFPLSIWIVSPASGPGECHFGNVGFVLQISRAEVAKLSSLM